MTTTEVAAQVANMRTLASMARSGDLNSLRNSRRNAVAATARSDVCTSGGLRVGVVVKRRGFAVEASALTTGTTRGRELAADLAASFASENVIARDVKTFEHLFPAHLAEVLVDGDASDAAANDDDDHHHGVWRRVRADCTRTAAVVLRPWKQSNKWAASAIAAALTAVVALLLLAARLHLVATITVTIAAAVLPVGCVVAAAYYKFDEFNTYAGSDKKLARNTENILLALQVLRTSQQNGGRVVTSNDELDLDKLKATFERSPPSRQLGGRIRPVDAQHADALRQDGPLSRLDLGARGEARALDGPP